MLDADKSVVYSKEDIQNAEWLTVRSKGTKVQWIYNEREKEQEVERLLKKYKEELLYRIGSVLKTGKELNG